MAKNKRTKIEEISKEINNNGSVEKGNYTTISEAEKVVANVKIKGDDGYTVVEV